MRRTPLTRRTPLRSMSKKRRRLQAARRRVCHEVKLRDVDCVARNLPTGIPCYGELVVHEKKPRGRGGSILDKENCVSVCTTHHDFLHLHPKLSREWGLTL